MWCCPEIFCTTSVFVGAPAQPDRLFEREGGREGENLSAGDLVPAVLYGVIMDGVPESALPAYADGVQATYVDERFGLRASSICCNQGRAGRTGRIGQASPGSKS